MQWQINTSSVPASSPLDYSGATIEHQLTTCLFLDILFCSIKLYVCGVFFCFFSLFFNWSIIALQCRVSFCCSTKYISYMYTYIPSLLDLPPAAPRPHRTHLGHHRALSWAPCAIQQVPTSHLFYTWSCIYVHPNLPVHPTPASPTTVSTRPLSTSASLFLICK